MRLKKGFVLREVCGERVITGEGLEAINFGKLLAEKLCEDYEVEKQTATADVAGILKEWQEVGVIEAS